MISVKDLRKRFGKQEVLQEVNLDVKKGEIFVILGESGSGKSVLLQHLIGLLKPDRGQIFLDGQDITRMSEKRLLLLRKHLGYLFQEGALYDFMTVYENVAFPLVEHTRLRSRQIKHKVEEMLRTLGIDYAAEKYPSELSGGMKKRAALARAVILESMILFCDEPTSGLDPIKSREITDVICQLARKFGTTTVITSHDIPNAFRAADRVIIIRQGRIVTTGTPAEVDASTDPFVQKFLER